MTDELEITEENFNDHFHDVRMHKPQRGEILARYAAVAEFVDGQMKRDIIDLIANKNKAEAAVRVMRKLACATEADSIRVCKEIAQDLVAGMSAKDVENKPYKYTIEVFYWTMKGNVPLDDLHWSVISINNLDEFLDAADQRLKMTTTILPQEKPEEPTVEA